jgi:hypothetical protein
VSLALPPRSPWRWLVVLVVLGAGLVLCHGCHSHSDEDDFAAFLFRQRHQQTEPRP